MSTLRNTKCLCAQYIIPRLNTSVSCEDGFVNKIKRVVLEVFVLLLKNFIFFMKSIHFSKAEKARNKMEV